MTGGLNMFYVKGQENGKRLHTTPEKLYFDLVIYFVLYYLDFTKVPTMVDKSDGTRAIMEIHSLSQDLSSCSHDDGRIILTEYVNCSGFLGSAPATNALIGQLLLISLKHDFAIDEKMPVGGFKILKQSKSFRVSMFQVNYN